jgi:hypothetical protein
MSKKYNKTIKIAYFTENQLHDLNVADYAIGLGHINHLDRYFTFPYIVYYLKRNKITPQKLRMKNTNIKPNLINSNYTKRINNHCQSVESNNNSMINSKLPRASINNSFQCDIENNLPQNKNNEYSDNLFNKSVIVVNQYDRNTELKKDNGKKNVIQHNMNNNINETKKIYYFYAIMNLIDKQNKRKLVKKWFYLWKSLIRFSRSFINSRGIEEKIINFKNKRSPIKSTNK